LSLSVDLSDEVIFSGQTTYSNILELVLDGCHGNFSRALQHLNLEILRHNEKRIAGVSFSHFNLSGSSLVFSLLNNPRVAVSKSLSAKHLRFLIRSVIKLCELS
jgi:hypothetical protein